VGLLLFRRVGNKIVQAVQRRFKEEPDPIDRYRTIVRGGSSTGITVFFYTVPANTHAVLIYVSLSTRADVGSTGNGNVQIGPRADIIFFHDVTSNSIESHIQLTPAEGIDMYPGEQLLVDYNGSGVTTTTCIILEKTLR